MAKRPPQCSGSVLLVDNEDNRRITMKWFLTSFGLVVDSARCAEEALALFDPKVHDLVVTDNAMRGMSGHEMAYVIKLRSPSTPVVLCTSRPPEDMSQVDAVLAKPVHLLAVKDAVTQLLMEKSASVI